MARRPARRGGESVEIDGFVVVDKPAGMTSHDVVARARRALSMRRLGHGGTLDPGATGVLVLGVGRATRLLRFVSELDKTYAGEIVFGATTTSLDEQGTVVERFAMDGLSIETVREAAGRFIGTIAQIPPMVSAIKVDGNRLYALARQGIEVERAPRSVVVTRFDIEPADAPAPDADLPDVPFVVRFVVSCSSGTYVRSLADDLGAALGGGAYLRALRRLSIGPFLVDDAVQLDVLDRAQVAPPLGLVAHLGQVEVDDSRIDAIAHGKVLLRRELEVSGDGPWALHDANGSLLAIYESWSSERIKPAVVLSEPATPVVGAGGGSHENPLGSTER